MTEKRSRPRFNDRSIVSITVKRTPGTVALSDKTLFCFTRDISMGGLSFTAHFPPPVGAKLSLAVAFASPARSVGNLTGKVAWVRRIPNGTQHVIGIDLRETDPDCLNNWREAVAERVMTE